MLMGGGGWPEAARGPRPHPLWPIRCDSLGRPRECLPEACMRGWVTKEQTSIHARANVCTADGGGASSRGVGVGPGGLGRSRLSLRRARPMPRRSAAVVACPPPVWLPPPWRSAQCAAAGVTRSGRKGLRQWLSWTPQGRAAGGGAHVPGMGRVATPPPAGQRCQRRGRLAAGIGH